MKLHLTPSILCAVLIATATACADTLRVSCYNALNLSGSSIIERRDDFRIVMESIDPDIAIFQEIVNEEAVDDLLSFAFLPVHDDWVAVTFHNGPYTDNACFYRSSKVAFVSQRAIPTDLRDITEYTLEPHGLMGSTVFRLYSAHLKASQGTDNEERRRIEAEALRAQLDQLAEGSLFAFGGDFNLYGASEPAYQVLLDDENPNGQLFDPINRYGEWHNSVSFADVHTQSPRGDFGGMDDRFDFILVSAALMDTDRSHVIPASYVAWGNDGQHFNQSINDGVNHMVSDEVADALHDASDHLPVVADFVFVDESSPVEPGGIAPTNHRLLSCYPNPFNSTLTVEISSLPSVGTLTVTNLMGRAVQTLEVPASPGAESSLRIPFHGQANGIYFVTLATQNVAVTQKVLFLK